MDLGDEGGYESVQMRDVAAKAGVAMGTVYRYFSSKDHLLAAALADWAGGLELRLAQYPPAGSTPADRVVDALSRTARAMGRRLGLVAAVVTALSSSDPGVVECQGQVSDTINRVIRSAIGEPEPPELDAIVRVLGYVWYSTLLGWVNGWSHVGRVRDELEVAARLLLR